jgi:hypothetical protein
VAAHPGQPLYWDRLAGLQEKRGRPDAAIASYRRLLARSPDLVESR